MSNTSISDGSSGLFAPVPIISGIASPRHVSHDLTVYAALYYLGALCKSQTRTPRTRKNGPRVHLLEDQAFVTATALAGVLRLYDGRAAKNILDDLAGDGLIDMLPCMSRNGHSLGVIVEMRVSSGEKRWMERDGISKWDDEVKREGRTLTKGRELPTTPPQEPNVAPVVTHEPAPVVFAEVVPVVHETQVTLDVVAPVVPKRPRRPRKVKSDLENRYAEPSKIKLVSGRYDWPGEFAEFIDVFPENSTSKGRVRGVGRVDYGAWRKMVMKHRDAADLIMISAIAYAVEREGEETQFNGRIRNWIGKEEWRDYMPRGDDKLVALVALQKSRASEHTPQEGHANSAPMPTPQEYARGPSTGNVVAPVYDTGARDYAAEQQAQWDEEDRIKAEKIAEDHAEIERLTDVVREKVGGYIAGERTRYAAIQEEVDAWCLSPDTISLSDEAQRAVPVVDAVFSALPEMITDVSASVGMKITPQAAREQAGEHATPGHTIPEDVALRLRIDGMTAVEVADRWPTCDAMVAWAGEYSGGYMTAQECDAYVGEYGVAPWVADGGVVGWTNEAEPEWMRQTA